MSRATDRTAWRRGMFAVFPVGAVLLMATGAGTPALADGVRAETVRTIYISATDPSGAPVTDLTAADIEVKEDGKVREVTSVTRATEPMDVHLFVDDAGSGAFQAGVLDLLQATIQQARFTIYQFTPQAVKLLDASTDFDAIQGALNQLGPRGRVDPNGEQVAEALGTTARALRESKPPRPVIVVMTIGGDSGHRNADLIMNQMRQSGANVNVIYLQTAGIGLVLGDSPGESGGQSERIGSVNAVGPAVQKITQALLNQYKVTYVLPDGVDPDDNVSVSTSRSGIKLLAPKRIPAE